MEAEPTPGAPVRQAVAERGGEMRTHGASAGRLPLMRVPVALTASVLALLAIPSVPAGARTPPAEVRVNQVGYDLHGPKRAYLMSPVSESGATFSVVRADGHV